MSNRSIRMGRYSYGAPTIHWNNANNKLIVGNFTSIGEGLRVFLGNGLGHDSTFISTFPFGYANTDVFPNVKNNSKNTNGDVVIGHDVWIGSNSTIMSGVTIGNGAVIAANSHVFDDVEPYSIVGGNPARFIKFRFTAEQIENLQRIEWWKWNEHKINENIPLLMSNNIDDFIQKHTTV